MKYYRLEGNDLEKSHGELASERSSEDLRTEKFLGAALGKIGSTLARGATMAARGAAKAASGATKMATSKIGAGSTKQISKKLLNRPAAQKLPTGIKKFFPNNRNRLKQTFAQPKDPNTGERQQSQAQKWVDKQKRIQQPGVQAPVSQGATTPIYQAIEKLKLMKSYQLEKSEGKKRKNMPGYTKKKDSRGKDYWAPIAEKYDTDIVPQQNLPEKQNNNSSNAAKFREALFLTLAEKAPEEKKSEIRDYTDKLEDNKVTELGILMGEREQESENELQDWAQDVLEGISGEKGSEAEEETLKTMAMGAIVEEYVERTQFRDKQEEKKYVGDLINRLKTQTLEQLQKSVIMLSAMKRRDKQIEHVDKIAKESEAMQEVQSTILDNILPISVLKIRDANERLREALLKSGNSPIGSPEFNEVNKITQELDSLLQDSGRQMNSLKEELEENIPKLDGLSKKMQQSLLEDTLGRLEKQVKNHVLIDSFNEEISKGEMDQERLASISNMLLSYVEQQDKLIKRQEERLQGLKRSTLPDDKRKLLDEALEELLKQESNILELPTQLKKGTKKPKWTKGVWIEQPLIKALKNKRSEILDPNGDILRSLFSQPEVFENFGTQNANKFIPKNVALRIPFGSSRSILIHGKSYPSTPKILEDIEG